MAFADHYPLAAFAAIADASWWRNTGVARLDPPDAAGRAEATRLDVLDRKRVEAHKADTLHPAILAHLRTLHAAGRLRPATGLGGRDVWQAEAWNRLVADEAPGQAERIRKEAETGWLVSLIGQAFTRCLVRIDKTGTEDDHVPGTHRPPTEAAIAKAWARLCAGYDSGDSGDRFGGWAIECSDELTGARGELRFEGWAATLMLMTPSYDMVPATDAQPLGLSAVDLAVPSGELLVTDVLRVAGIEEGTDLGKADYAEAGLGSEKGRMRRTQLHAERHGMGYCQTENTSVAVFRSDDGNRLAFMECGQKPMRGWAEVGTVSCDVWRISVLDRATAVTLAAAGGNGDADADLARYLALAAAPNVWTGEGDWPAVMHAHHEQCYARNVVRIDVPAGKWTFHSGPDFQAKADKKALGLPKASKPWAAMVRRQG